MSVITKEWLATDIIDSQVLTNNTFSKGRNNANDGDVNIFKVNASDKIEAGADLNMGSFNIITNGNVDGVDVSAKSTNVSNLVTLSGVAADSTTLGNFSGSIIPDAQNIKQALQALETYEETSRSLINNFEWYPSSALDYVVDNTAAPATEVLNDVYVLSHNGGAPHADYDGASAGDIVKFNGSAWVATTPTAGMMISIDDETTSLRQWSGSAWVQKSFESTTASTGLTKSGVDIRLAEASAANGIAVSSGGAISVVLNSSHLEIASTAISIKANAIGETELNNADGAVDAQSFVLPTGYTAGAGTVAAGDTIDAAIRKLDGNISAMAGADAEEELFTMSAQNVTDGFLDLAQVAMAGSVMVFPVNGPKQLLGTDYSISYTGGVGSKTRITLLGDMITKMVEGKKVVINYLRA